MICGNTPCTSTSPKNSSTQYVVVEILAPALRTFFPQVGPGLVHAVFSALPEIVAKGESDEWLLFVGTCLFASAVLSLQTLESSWHYFFVFSSFTCWSAHAYFCLAVSLIPVEACLSMREASTWAVFLIAAITILSHNRMRWSTRVFGNGEARLQGWLGS